MIEVDISKCTGCRKCESFCSFFRTGRVNSWLSRIKVLNLYETGIDGPVVCVQCKERYCDRCPENAITIGTLGQIIVSPTLCNLCGVCVKACPIGAVEVFDNFVYVCDLCGGRPKCVESCTEGAIIYKKEKKRQLSLADFKKQAKKMNTSEKRFNYLKKLGSKLRKIWSEKYA